jgi:hypothetical protein
MGQPMQFAIDTFSEAIGHAPLRKLEESHAGEHMRARGGMQ